MTLDEAVGGLLTAVASGVVLGIAVLIVVYKMIDGDIPPGPGACALLVLFVSMLVAVKPPHPILSGIVLVVTLTLMIFFPFALSTMEKAELQAMDTDRLERAYRALAERPDNIAAQFELARSLHSHGMTRHAIEIASHTLEGISTQIDPIKNASLRDAFRGEEYMVKSWKKAISAGEKSVDPVKCPGCGTMNSIGMPVCTGCQRPYLLEMARGLDIRPKIIGRLVLAWAALAGFLVVSATVGVTFQGWLMYVVFVVALAAVAFFINWLFRKPRLAV